LVISPARKIAFDVLRLVEEEDAYASDVLHAQLTSGIKAHVKTEDAALATELAMGVLRWRGFLDFVLQRSLKQPIARLDFPVILALRMGTYQLRFLQRIPARAAVNESVELVKRSRKSSAATLVNAVLRRISSETAIPADQLVPSSLPQAERLSILQSHPKWMIERWIAAFGDDATIAVLRANNAAPRLSCAIHSPEQRSEVLSELMAAEMNVEDGALLDTAIAVSGGSPARTEAFRNGKISIQDEASQAIPLLLDVHAGDRVLDLCAAPGGKTVQLAGAAGSEGSIVAADLHGHRLRAMGAQFERLRIPDIRMVQVDATRALPFANYFDRILVDAPCSGTGTLARHPEIRWRLQPEQLHEFHQLQVKILSNAAAHLAPGGKLVYSTCSLEPEENEQVVAEALRKLPGVRLAAKPEVGRDLRQHLASSVQLSDLLDNAGQFRTMPGRNRTDGFFAAVIVRK
jgi:16S rRNA (cytosine967-C5)-methyltransferase